MHALLARLKCLKIQKSILRMKISCVIFVFISYIILGDMFHVRAQYEFLFHSYSVECRFWMRFRLFRNRTFRFKMKNKKKNGSRQLAFLAIERARIVASVCTLQPSNVQISFLFGLDCLGSILHLFWCRRWNKNECVHGTYVSIVASRRHTRIL